MSRRNSLAGIDPLGSNNDDDQEQKPLSVNDADAALFGELARREANRQNIKPISIFDIFPDVQQPRRAVPLPVRRHWSGKPKDIADLFNAWLTLINEEREQRNQPPFDLDDYLWAEEVERRGRTEKELVEIDKGHQAGPIERAFVQVIDLAVSIRRDGLANPVTVQRTGGNSFRLETGERRWLAYHVLYGYFNGHDNKPEERDKWGSIPAIIVERFNVWRQASENTARADLNAVGRARQYAILMMDMLTARGEQFQPYEALVNPGESDRPYYAQVAEHRVPNGRGEMLANGMGVSHRSAFTRCRTLLSLPDEVWMIGDMIDMPEDELLRLARLEPEDAIKEARAFQRIVATRNNSSTTTPASNAKPSPPALFDDAALKRGKRLFPKEIERVAKELLRIKDGVGEAKPKTKREIRTQIDELRLWLNKLEATIDD